jgi:hypothetical protein
MAETERTALNDYIEDRAQDFTCNSMAANGRGGQRVPAPVRGYRRVTHMGHRAARLAGVANRRL